jgi:hypothetical protein
LLLLLGLLVFSSYKLISEIIESFVSHQPVFNLESMAVSMIFLQQKSELKAWISTLKSTMRLQLIQVYPLKGGLELRWACNNYIRLEFLADGMVGKTSNAQYCSLDKYMSFFSFLFLRLWYCSCRVYFIK